MGGGGGGCCEWSGSLLQERARSLVSFVCAQELTLPRINPLPFSSLFVFPPLFLSHNQHQTSWRGPRGREVAFINPIGRCTNNLSVACNVESRLSRLPRQIVNCTSAFLEFIHHLI